MEVTVGQGSALPSHAHTRSEQQNPPRITPEPTERTQKRGVPGVFVECSTAASKGTRCRDGLRAAPESTDPPSQGSAALPCSRRRLVLPERLAWAPCTRACVPCSCPLQLGRSSTPGSSQPTRGPGGALPTTHTGTQSEDLQHPRNEDPQCFQEEKHRTLTRN